MLQQCRECLLIGGLILPVGEVADMTEETQIRDPSPAGGHDGIIQSNGEEDLPSHIH